MGSLSPGIRVNLKKYWKAPARYILWNLIIILLLWLVNLSTYPGKPFFLNKAENSTLISEGGGYLSRGRLTSHGWNPRKHPRTRWSPRPPGRGDHIRHARCSQLIPGRLDSKPLDGRGSRARAVAEQHLLQVGFLVVFLLGGLLTLQGINISHLGKRKIIFKMAIFGGYVSFLEGICNPHLGKWSDLTTGAYFSNGVGEKPPTSYLSIYIILKLKLTAKAAENGWFQYDRFLLGQFRPIFRKNVLVSGSVLVSP